jgi:hypothetical protein
MNSLPIRVKIGGDLLAGDGLKPLPLQRGEVTTAF